MRMSFGTTGPLAVVLAALRDTLGPDRRRRGALRAAGRFQQQGHRLAFVAFLILLKEAWELNELYEHFRCTCPETNPVTSVADVLMHRGHQPQAEPPYRSTVELVLNGLRAVLAKTKLSLWSAKASQPTSTLKALGD